MNVPVRLAALAAIGITVLAGCGQSPGTASTAAAKPAPPSCHQQYETWKHTAATRWFQSRLAAVQAAGAVDDIPKLVKTLKAAGKAAARVPAMPRCADPAGYTAQVLTRIEAAGDNAGAGSGLGGLMLAEVPLKALPAVEAKLKAELKRTAQVS